MAARSVALSLPTDYWRALRSDSARRRLALVQTTPGRAFFFSFFFYDSANTAFLPFYVTLFFFLMRHMCAAAHSHKAFLETRPL